MEKLSSNIANYISRELGYDNNKKDVIAYGTFALLQTILSIILVLLFGSIFHVMVEALIISFSTSIFRKYSGGAHASLPSICTAIGTIFPVGQALILKLLINSEINLGLVLFVVLVTFVWCYYIVTKLAPVDSPAKPIKKEEKRKRMNKGSLMILNIYIVIIILNIILYFFIGTKKMFTYTLSIYCGTIWQTFTLTNLGHKSINVTERLIIYIPNKLRR